jgi:hypothetical protein
VLIEFAAAPPTHRLKQEKRNGKPEALEGLLQSGWQKRSRQNKRKLVGLYTEIEKCIVESSYTVLGLVC